MKQQPISMVTCTLKVIPSFISVYELMGLMWFTVGSVFHLDLLLSDAYTMKGIKQENLGEEFDKRYKDEATT